MTARASRPRVAIATTLIVAAIALALQFGSTAPAVSATPDQLVWFNGVGINTHDKYATMWPDNIAGAEAVSGSWTDYKNGHVYARATITSKPSSYPMLLQMCLWDNTPGTNDHYYEACSRYPDRYRFTDETTFWLDLGTPTDSADWWKKPTTPVWDWDTFGKVRWMLFDAARPGQLMLIKSCGAYCFQPQTLAAISPHVPVTIDSTIVLVKPGATLQANQVPGFAGCPASWSTTCGGGGPNPTTPPPTTPPPTTPPPTTPPPTTPPPTDPPAPGNGNIAVIAGAAAPIPSGDRPALNALAAAGFTYTVFDDDAIPANTVLDDYDAVVVMSSVVPTKIPAGLATVATGLVNSEAYVMDDLGLATSGKELASQTQLNVLLAGHPIAGGLSGLTTVSSSVAFGIFTPRSTASVIAKLPGGQTSLFAYDPGDLTSGGAAAPARRVGFYFSYTGPAAANAAGMGLFVDSVAWAAA